MGYASELWCTAELSRGGVASRIDTKAEVEISALE